MPGVESRAALLEALPVGVCACDADGLVVHCNAKAVELWGCPATPRDPTQRWGAVIPRRDARGQPLLPPAFPLARSLAANAPVAACCTLLERQDGSSLAIISCAVPVFDEAKALLGAIECFQEAPPASELPVGDEIGRLQQRVLEQEMELQHRRTQLRLLAADLSQAEHRTRRRVAASLHDELAQLLLVAQMKLRLVEPSAAGEASQACHDLAATLNDAMQYTRTLMHELAPPMLYDLGLTPALEALAEKYRQRHGLRVLVADDGQPKPLSEDVRATVFEAVRELLMNVVKHAHTSRARVSLRREGDWIRVVVEDGGVGFDLAKAAAPPTDRGGFGLHSIRQRFELLSGGVSLDAAPGHGCRVEIRVAATDGPSSQVRT